MTHISNALTPMRVQHELGMAVGSEIRLEPMLRHFLDVCVSSLSLEAAYVYVNVGRRGEVAVALADSGRHCVYCAKQSEVQTLSSESLVKLATEKLNKLDADGSLFCVFENNEKKYILFPLEQLGGVILGMSTSVLNTEIIAAIEPVIKRLGVSCLASIEYERSVRETQKNSEVENAFLESEVRLRSVLDNVIDGIITLNETGDILSFNAAAEQIFGYSLEEALGLNVKDLMADLSGWDDDTHINLFKFEGDDHFRGFGREVMGQRKDGSRFPMDWALSEVHVEGQRLFTGIARDITERREVESSLKEQLRYAKAISCLTEVLIREDLPQDILDQTVAIIGEALHADRALIASVDCKNTEALVLAEWLNESAAVEIVSTRNQINISQFSNIITAIMAKEQTWLESHLDDVNRLVVADNLEDLLHRQLAIKSLLYYPFWFSEKGFYVLAFDQVEQRRTWRSEDIDFINAVAQHISVALRKVALLREREKHVHDLKLAATAFETHEAILIADKDSVIQRVNKAFTRITGYSSEEVVGKTPRILKSGRQSKLFYQKMWAELNKVGHWQGEIWNKRKNGDIYPEWQTITAVHDDNGVITHFVSTFQDITERKRNETRIKHLAYYDELTTLPNRSLLTDRLRHELAVARRRGLIGALLIIDLDRFKTINDSLGHPIGDIILQQIAKRLQSQVRGEDTVARLGGDEFVILLPGIGSEPAEASKAVQIVAEKTSQVIGEPYNIEGNEYHLTPSIGIVLFPEESEGVDDILKHADTAMYRAKASGRNTIRFYLPSMQEAADERLSLEKDLRHAISRGELALHYQPQVDNKGCIIGAEALIRWIHPTRGMVAPDQFIGIAEETGQIFAVGEWVLRTAVAQIADWRSRSLKGNMQFLAVNVSPRQFHQINFVPQVISILEEAGVPPYCLKIEITEGIVMADVQDAIDKMASLKALGVRFAIDDFGTGYSSMSYLKRMPLDQLKIDKSFVQDVSTDPNAAAIVETIIVMAKHLGLDVVAEGVETEEELAFLEAHGCKVYQGYYFSRPVPTADFSDLLKRHVDGERMSTPLSSSEETSLCS